MMLTPALDRDINITDAKEAALLACFRAGHLTMSQGRWRGSYRDPPVSGQTVAALGQDGLFDIDRRRKRNARTYLTTIGRRLALMLAAQHALT